MTWLSRSQSDALRVLCFTWLLRVAVFFLVGSLWAQGTDGSPLTSFAAVKRLPASEAAKGLAVEVEAAVLFAHPSTGWFVHFFYDGTDGIYVKLRDWQGDLEAGDQVLLKGVTGPGDFAPIITDAVVELSGKQASLPVAADPSAEELARGVYDSRWVGIEGTVRSVRWVDVHVVMELMRDNRRFSATIVGFSEDSYPRDIVGSQMQLRGVYAPLFNRNRQLTGFHFYVPGTQFVERIGESLGDPFELEIEPVAGILGYGRRGGGNQRVRAVGTVELVVSETEFFMSDTTNGVRVETVESHGLLPGDGADVVGFAELGDYSPILRDCEFRKREESVPIDLISPTVEDLLLGTHEARLVTVSGRLVNLAMRGEVSVFTVRKAGSIFNVEMVGEMSPEMRETQEGSLLQVTGICVVEVDSGKNPIGFHILANESGVKVVSQPSWWTVRNTLFVLAGLFVFFLFVVAWGVTLQRRLSRQTSIIRDEYERQAVLQRRYQDLFENANDVVFAIDVNGYFSVLNQAGEQLLQISREEAKTKVFLDLVAPPDRGALKEALEPDRKKTGERRVELVLDHLEKPIALEVSFRGIRENGRLIGFEGIARDLTERKKAQAKLEETQKELVHASRQAGMAEVATGVLHNVGNVLNSVNVSGQTALDLAKKFRLDPLEKVAALLETGREQAGFLSKDPKGQKLPEYLSQLSSQLVTERGNIQNELKSLLESIEHTKDIVAMQQAYARTGGLRDSLVPADLVEDAIRLNAGALTRHEVTLVRAFEPTQKISVDRTRILQVLINLIRNAKYACDEAETSEKVLTIGIAPSDFGVRITVSDTGVGIPKENLTKIFAYGFTTRKDGHGFGLHSSALAAKEMGGDLSVMSEGPGKGASFRLDLPLCNDEEVE